jgi:hypothetical protein
MAINTVDSCPLLAYTRAPFTPGANMELRNHSQMIWQGRRNWPPKWTGPHNSENPLPEGEVGVLTRVETTDPSLIAPHCILVIRHGNEDYVGSLFFNDEEFLQKICRMLNDHIGLSISEIGSLDIP